jgi:hypothetical protein
VARRGYLGLHADFLKDLKKNSALERAA